MRVTLVAADGSRIACRVAESGTHVVASRCPSCEHDAPRIRGTGIDSRTHDTYSAPARCAECGSDVGRLECKVETIFGIEEDDRVLRHGRARVYG